MYKILENPVILTAGEIHKQFDGKWVYITNCEFTPGDKLIRGIPRVVADMQAEGAEEGIYKVYRDKDVYGRTLRYSLLDFDYLIPNISFEVNK